MSKNGAGYDPDIEDVWPVDEDFLIVEDEREVSFTLSDFDLRKELGMRKIANRSKINFTQNITAIIFAILFIVGINFVGYVIDVPGGLFN